MTSASADRRVAQYKENPDFSAVQPGKPSPLPETYSRNPTASTACRDRAPRRAPVLENLLVQRLAAVDHDPGPLHAHGAEVVAASDAELHPGPAFPQLAAAARFGGVDGEPGHVPLAVAGETAGMALPPGAVRATEPKSVRCNGRVDVSRVALLGRDPDVIAGLARVPCVNPRHVTADMHRAEHVGVTECE